MGVWSQVVADANANRPRSATIAALAVYEPIVVTWVLIAISLLEMCWVVFIVGAVMGLVVFDFVFRPVKRSAAHLEHSAPG